eukprot:4193049-Alexandrium_andersonii.AAC.1
MAPLPVLEGEGLSTMKPLEAQRLRPPKDVRPFDGDAWLGPGLYMASREPLTLAVHRPDPRQWKWPRAD